MLNNLKMKKLKIESVLCLITIFMGSCSKNSGTITPTGDVDITSVVQAKFANSFTNAITVTVSGSNLVIKSDGRPNHKSPYWLIGNANYEAFQAGHATNPAGAIGIQNYTQARALGHLGRPTEALNKIGASLALAQETANPAWLPFAMSDWRSPLPALATRQFY